MRNDVNGGGGPDDPIDAIGARVESGLARLMEGVGVGGVFGAPEQAGDRTVITAATVVRSGGFGFGGGVDLEEDEQEIGGGGGGGGHSLARPVAVIVVGPEGVEVKPVIDFTHIGVTLLATAVTMIRALR